MATNILDVAIVGAGLSGLQAALDIQGAGLTCTVFEARDRVGGKTFSQPRKDGKGIQELGAAWINDTNQSRIFALTQQFGLHTVVQATGGSCTFHDADLSTHYFAYGDLPKFPDDARANCAAIRDAIHEASLDDSNFTGDKRTHLDSRTFENYLQEIGADDRALQLASVWCHGMLGVEPSDISALCFLELCRGGGGLITMRSDCKDGAQYLRIVEGTQSISQDMAKLLRPGTLRLSTPVTAITKSAEDLLAVTLQSSEVVLARRVVVSVPTPAYKNISFTPPLPPKRAAYITSARYGFYTKYITMFTRPIWRENGGCGLVTSVGGPASILRDTSVDADENFALTAFISATPGRKWDMLPPEEQLSAMLKQIATVYGLSEAYVRDNYVDSMVSPWMRDCWAGYGCPLTSMPPGVLDEAGKVITESFNAIHFVGTELSDVWRGYMEGAVRSGARGAKEVIDALTPIRSRA